MESNVDTSPERKADRDSKLDRNRAASCYDRLFEMLVGMLKKDGMFTYNEDLKENLSDLRLHIGLHLHNFAGERRGTGLEGDNNDLYLRLGDLDGISRG